MENNPDTLEQIRLKDTPSTPPPIYPSTEDKNEEWDLIIEPQTAWFDLKIKDILQYKDLMFLFVRRDIVTVYKQTILGP